ncbi:MAG TPA: Hpt domain-containing protein [Pirellulales bacterium]|nr:Hpt domain-containing protein [Pirellulales bacterium]
MGGPCEPQAAIGRLGGDLELYRELVRSFLNDSAGLLPRLRAAISAGDADALHKAAHGLKGVAATCGAVGVAEVAASLEASAVDRNLSVIGELNERLHAELAGAANLLAVYYW